MRIHFRPTFGSSFAVSWFRDLISSSLLSETQVQYEIDLHHFHHPGQQDHEGRKWCWIFPPSQTRSLTELRDGTMVYEERYTFGDRVDIIHFALAFGWTTSIEDDYCLTYPPLGELLP